MKQARNQTKTSRNRAKAHRNRLKGKRGKMRFMREEQKKKYPRLVVAAWQCQSYVKRMYGHCHGCSTIVPGCEKIIREEQGGQE